MSWLQDLAGKAENLLNKIDQNAATVLQQSASKSTTEVASVVAPNKLPPPVMLEIESDKPPSNAFIRHPSNLSLASSSHSSSPKPKALSLRGASPALSDAPKSAAVPPAAVYIMPSAPTSSVDSNPGDIDAPAPFANQTSPSAATSRRSSVSSVTRPGPVDAATTLSADQQNELVALKIILSEIKAERDDARNEVRSLQNELFNLQANATVSLLEANCASLQRTNEELAASVESLQQSNGSYVKTISELEQRLARSVQSEAEMRSKIEWINKESAQAVNELQQYRSRAQSTLQLKDRLIEQLRTVNGVDGDEHSNETAAGKATHTLELEHLQRDKNELLNEVKSLADQLAQARAHIASSEATQQQRQADADGTADRLNEQLLDSQRRWQALESESRAQVRELATVRDELTRVQTEFAAKVHAKDAELAQHRSQASAQSRQSAAISSYDIGGRIQSLTQSLVQKQSSLETVTADRNALRFQLEKIEHEYRDAIARQQQQQQQPQRNTTRSLHTHVSVNDTDDAKARVPMFMQETPFDTRVSRRVKRVYSSLDSVGVRVGGILRQYPLIRILAIFYVVLLHLWVMVVLCTSTPN